MMKRLLIVAHTPSENTQRLANAALSGANNDDVERVTCVIKSPFDAGPQDILTCDGILLGTPENLGYMSGALKDFFDRSYYRVLETKPGLPCALYIRAGVDGTGTRRAVESIVTGLRWRWVQPALTLRGEWHEEFVTQVEALGLYMAAGLDNGLF